MTMKQDKIRIITDAIFRKVIINMYITHSILQRVNYNFILFYEFATNRDFNLSRTDAQCLPAWASLNNNN